MEFVRNSVKQVILKLIQMRLVNLEETKTFFERQLTNSDPPTLKLVSKQLRLIGPSTLLFTGDIKLVGTLGDFLASGSGAHAQEISDSGTDYRGASFLSGQQF